MSNDKALVEEARLQASVEMHNAEHYHHQGLGVSANDCATVADLLDRLATALEARSGRDEGLEEAAKVADQHAQMCADLAYDYNFNDKRDIAHIWKTAHSQMSACAKDIRALKDKQP